MFKPQTLYEAICLAKLQEATLAFEKKTTPILKRPPSPIRAVPWSPIQQSTVVAEEEDSLQPKFGVDNHPAMDAPQVFDESPKPSTCIKSDERNGKGLEYAQEGLETMPCEQLGGLKPSSGSLENSDRCVQEEVNAGGQMDDETFSDFGSILPCTMATGASGQLKGCGFENAVDALNGKKFDEKGWYVGKSQNKAEGEAEMKQKFEQTTKETVVRLVFDPGEEMDTTVFSSGMLNSVRNGPKEWYDHMHPSKAAIQLIKYQDHDGDLVTVTCVDELRLAEASMDVNSGQDPTVIVKGNGGKSSSQASVPDAKSDETTPTVERSGLAPGSSTAHSSNELQDRDGNLAALVAGTADASSTVVMTHEVSQEVEIPAAIKVEVVPSFLNGESSHGNVSPIPSRVPASEFVNQPGKEKTHSVLDDADGTKSKPLDSTAAAIPKVTKKGNDKEQTSLNKRHEPLEEAQGLLKSANSSGHSKETRLARVCAGFSSRLKEYKSGSARLEELLAAARELSKSYEVQIKQLQLALAAATKEMTRVESSMGETLAAKNSEIETLVSSLDNLKKQVALSEGSMASLQANVETTLVNLVHYAFLVATNAERHQMMARKSKMLLEFGLTQAQGPGGGVSTARCCYLGGFDATCNVAAGSLLGRPLKGTHSHAFVSLFMNPDEIVEKSPCSADGSTTCEDFVGLVHTRLHKILRTRVSVEDQWKLKLLDGFELGKVKLQQVLIQAQQKLQQTSNVQLHTAIGVLVAIILLSLIVRLFKRKKSNRIVLASLPGGGKPVLFYSSHQGAVTSRDPNEGTFMLHSGSTKRGQDKSVNLVDVPGHSHLRPKLDQYLPQAVGLMFVVDDIDPQIHEWKKKAKYIGLYGGDLVSKYIGPSPSEARAGTVMGTLACSLLATEIVAT